MPLLILLVLAVTVGLSAAPLEDSELQRHFDWEVGRIEKESLQARPGSIEEWRKQRELYRGQLFEMLSLSPLPERTDLHPVVTGRLETNGIVVEKLHFQSLPGLYVTANFYRPKEVTNPLPTILYLCGHAQVRSNGVSYGNKTFYQHHGAWFARHGYTCLILDTIQLGEIEGLHHGTHREGMWWWNSRGYTPAGVEAWNAIRALDYLETRPEVDAARFGVTGRSGGGAYSWWTAALDERIKVAAPVAGITDLRNHVVDGVVEGHCDCMFMVNTYRWDYPRVAALVAPRPLLICNSDKDTIFPLDGVLRTHREVADIYRLYGAEANLGLLITEGPHQDTQDLQVPVFRWFNRRLKGEDPLIESAAVKLFRPDQLKVFADIPADERTSRIHETFVPANDQAVSTELLRAKVFAGWPTQPCALDARIVENHTLPEGAIELRFQSQPHQALSLFLAPARGEAIRMRVLDETSRPKIGGILGHSDAGYNAVLLVRGSEPGEKLTRTEVQIRRRYMLLGQTLDGMRVYDILRACEALQAHAPDRAKSIRATAEGRHASNLALAALFAPNLAVELPKPATFANTADYLNISRFTSLERVIAQLGRRASLSE